MARDITQRFLALLPFESHDDMSEKIKKFTNTYSEFSNIFIQYLNLEEKYKTGDLLQKINILMQGDKLQALATISAKL